MKLQQLRFLIEIDNQQLNISKAAKVLCTSQSGISKQIMLLEHELGVQLFIRKSKKLLALTSAGREIVSLAKQALFKVEDIKLAAVEYAEQKKRIGIATTHTQARYVLPLIVERFLSLFPEVSLNIQQGTPEQVSALLEQGEVDIAIASEVLADREALVAMPCYQWSRSVICKTNHPLTAREHLTLQNLVQYPIITYVQGFTGRHSQDEVFEKQRLQPNVVLSAADADVIKTYVRLGLGIGIIAEMAYSDEQDQDLSVFNVEHLFGRNRSYIAIKKDRYIKTYVYPFIEMFAPHLTQPIIREAISCLTVEQRQQLFTGIPIPLY